MIFIPYNPTYVVSAGTGFVGIRYPGHPVAQRLLAEAKVPVAAPSANRFGHVSPTESSHVWKDLCMESISILDDTQIFSEELELSPESTASCAIGIESTVVKLLPSTNEVLILRHGGVSESALKELPSLTVRNIFSKTQNSSDNIHAHSAPGQLISHYAPDVTAYLVQDLNTVTTNDSNMVATKDSISSAVIIDFMGQLLKHKDNCLSYMDLSPRYVYILKVNVNIVLVETFQKLLLWCTMRCVGQNKSLKQNPFISPMSCKAIMKINSLYTIDSIELRLGNRFAYNLCVCDFFFFAKLATVVKGEKQRELDEL